MEVSGLESATPSVTDVNVRKGKLHIIIVTAILTIIVIGGTLEVFHRLVGQHIKRLKRLNQLNRGTKVARWGIHMPIPNNEVGELIREREKLLDKIEESSDEKES